MRRRVVVAALFVLGTGCNAVLPYATPADSRRSDVVVDQPRADARQPDATGPDAATRDRPADDKARVDEQPDAARDAPTVDSRRDARAADGARPDAPRADGAKLDLKLLDVKTPDAKTPDAKTPDAKTPDAKTPDLTKPDAAVLDGGSCVLPNVVESCDPGGWCTIPAGCFKMGSPPTELCRNSSNETQHKVTLTHVFVISRAQVTQSQFQSVMSYNPSFFSGCPGCPVEQVSWHQATAYCNTLSAAKGFSSCYSCAGTTTSVICSIPATYQGAGIYSCIGYRLPTDAEYEYAVRAGTSTALYDGALGECDTKPDATAETIAWYKSNGKNRTHVVGQLVNNGWGLSDMAGNVWEWIHDWYVADLGTAAAADPAGPLTGTSRVIRGGSYFDAARFLRSASRYPFAPANILNTQGFRCVRSMP